MSDMLESVKTLIGDIKRKHDEFERTCVNRTELEKYFRETSLVEIEARLKDWAQKIESKIPDVNSLRGTADLAGRERQTVWDHVRACLNPAYRKTLSAERIGEMNARAFPDLPEQSRTLGLSSGADGGYFSPPEFVSEVLRKIAAPSVMLSIARVVPGVGLSGTWPREASTVTAYRGTERQDMSASASAPTFGAIRWNLSKLFGYVTVPRELLTYSRVDIMDLVVAMFADALRLKVESDLTNGDGGLAPVGLRNDTTGMTSVAQVGTNGEIDYHDVLSIKHALPVQYRLQGSTFLMNDTVIQKVAKIRDAGGLPIFAHNQILGGQAGNGTSPQTVQNLLGIKVKQNDYIPDDLGSGDDESEIWHVTDQVSYLYFLGEGMEMGTSEEAGFATDTVHVKVRQYDDGAPGVLEASAVLTGVK